MNNSKQAKNKRQRTALSNLQVRLQMLQGYRYPNQTKISQVNEQIRKLSSILSLEKT